MPRTAIAVTVVLGTLMLSGCVTPMPAAQQARLDGVIVYGWVSIAPEDIVSKDRWNSTLAKQSCTQYSDPWCSDVSQYDFVSALIFNTYWGGLRSVGTFVPKAEKIGRNHIIVLRFRAHGAGEYLRIASRIEKDDCRWDGGGVTRALTAAGVICEDYDWRNIAPLFAR